MAHNRHMHCNAYSVPVVSSTHGTNSVSTGMPKTLPSFCSNTCPYGAEAQGMMEAHYSAHLIFFGDLRCVSFEHSCHCAEVVQRQTGFI